MCSEIIEKPKKHISLDCSWCAPCIPNTDEIPKGDMPGDKVQITEGHIAKAKIIFSKLLDMIIPMLNNHPYQRTVISVHGGSGVGKSEIGSLLAYYFNCMNIGSYVLSGDNYPHRIPFYNDAERYRIFRTNGIKALVAQGVYTSEIQTVLSKLQENDNDANPALTTEYPWLTVYQEAGLAHLTNYLGTRNEIDFAEVANIIEKFNDGAKKILLKRMGRELKDLWYDMVDFSNINVIIIEWTHGNNENLKGVDLPIFLNSTPQETLLHRSSRNRDGCTDSPFTTMVLNIEQNLLHSQSQNAKIIVTKSGDIISYDKYLSL